MIIKLSEIHAKEVSNCYLAIIYFILIGRYLYVKKTDIVGVDSIEFFIGEATHDPTELPYIVYFRLLLKASALA